MDKDRTFLAWLTLSFIAASLWIFKSYLHYLLVAGVLALATSYLHIAIQQVLSKFGPNNLIHRNREFFSAIFLTVFFLAMIFGPMSYFVAVTIDQASAIDIDQVKLTLDEMVVKTIAFLDKVPALQEPLTKLRESGLAFIKGPALESALSGATDVVARVGALFGQIMWIMIFYFLFNANSKKILLFIAELVPMSWEQEKYLYKECSGTVSVVFYGTLFNMVAQGLAFGLLMLFVGDYNAVYLGVLAGFCSVIPLIGVALVYVPVVALELLAGNFTNAIVIVVFAWVVMGFFIDNILRLIFIGFLKKIFGFEYKMNEILILLAILAGIASLGFWGLVIGPSVLALTFAAANLYSTGIVTDSSVPKVE